jgi:hypothetical protein
MFISQATHLGVALTFARDVHIMMQQRQFLAMQLRVDPVEE